MSLLTKTAIAPSTSGRAPIGYGKAEDFGKEFPLDPGKGQGLIRSSIDYTVDDSHAPDYFLVKVKYGMYYQPDGWSYKSYTLKLHGGANGDLHYEMVAGNDKNLISKDSHAQAGPFIMYHEGYRLYFGARTRFLGTADGKSGPQLNLFTQDMKSLSLKVG